MRSFTIDKIEKSTGSVLRYNGGRFISETPAGAARKMYSQGLQHCRTDCKTFKITLHETTQGSNKKEYKYKVSKIKNDVVVEHKGEEVHYKFTTKVKSMN